MPGIVERPKIIEEALEQFADLFQSKYPPAKPGALGRNRSKRVVLMKIESVI